MVKSWKVPEPQPPTARTFDSTSTIIRAETFNDMRTVWQEFVDTFKWTNIRAVGYSLWTKGDTNAFFALFFDNLGTQLLLTMKLVEHIFKANGPGKLASFAFDHIMPGIGISMLFGNAYYSLQASKIATRTGNTSTCALPYGISTPAAFAMLYSIFSDVYRTASNGEDAIFSAALKSWKVAIAGNFICGLIEVISAFFLPFMMKHVHSAILLTPIAGIGLAILTFGQLHDIMKGNPVVGLPSLLIVWYGTFGGGKFGPIPVGFVSIAIGTIAAWAFGIKTTAGFKDISGSVEYSGFFQCFEEMGEIGPYMSFIIPIAATNALETLQNVRSAAEDGDVYNSVETMIVDGLGTMLGALCGSPFGTTVYIGQTAFKRLGGRRGYSLLNGLMYFVLGMTGIHRVLAAVIPTEAVSSLILFVGLCIAKQALELGPLSWTPSILLGCVFPFATIVSIYTNEFRSADVGLGIYVLKGGSMFTSFLWTSAFVAVTDRKLLRAAGYWLLCALFAAFGFIHSAEIGLMDKTLTLHNVCGELSKVSCSFLHNCMWNTGDDQCEVVSSGMPGYKPVLAYILMTVICSMGYVLQAGGCIEGPVIEGIHATSRDFDD